MVGVRLGALLGAALVLCVACDGEPSGAPPAPDAATLDGGGGGAAEAGATPADATAADTGAPDSTPTDSAPGDASAPFDAQPVDAQPVDAALVDAEPMPDAEVIDAEPMPDAAPIDAEPMPDAEVVDAEPMPDAEVIDAAIPDAAPPPPEGRLNELSCAGEIPWVELVTADTAAGDLAGWWLADRAVNADRRLILDVAVPADGWAVVDLAEAPFDPCGGVLFLGRPDGAIVDELVGPVPATGSRGRLPDREGPWFHTAQTPGAFNAPRVPGRAVLNEVDCQGRDWIELYNPGDVPTDLDGWAVTDRVDDPERGYPLSGVVAPGAFFSVRQAQGGGPGFDFGVACGGETITLIDAFGEVADAQAIPALLPDTTWSRIPDGDGAWQPGEPTRGDPNTPPVDDAAWLFEPTTVHTVALTVDALGMERLERDPRQPVDGTVQIDDEEARAVGLRLKGRIGSFRPLDRKSGFKLDFEFGGAERFFGVEKVALNNMVQDRSKVHEFAAYTLFRAVGVAAPRTSYAQVTLNGEDYGLYAVIEVIDGPALDRWFVTTSHMYEGAYGQDLFVDRLDELDRDAGDNDRGQLYRLVAALDAVSEADGFEATLGLVDWPQVATMMAAEIWIGHWDGYGPTRNNYYLHFDADDVLRMMPWGTDQTFDRRLGFYDGRGRLLRVCLADPDCRALFDQALVDVTLAVAREALADRITALAERLRPLAELDPRLEHGLGAMDNSVAGTLRFLTDRAAQLEPLVSCLTAEDRDGDDDGADCRVDCDDDDPTRFPGAVDVCGDGIDQDCNGWPDDDLTCPDCVPIVRAEHRYLVCPTPRTADEAATRCADEGSAPLRLDTAEEGRWIHGEAARVRRQRYWLGLSDGVEEGVFRWVVDGGVEAAPRWQANQPDGGADANCVTMVEDGDGPWSDERCDERHGTVCEDPCNAADPDGDGVTVCAGDCAPDDPAAYPGAVEVCGNDVDEDCDDALDDEDRCPRCEAIDVAGRPYRMCRSGRFWPQAMAECAVFGETLVSFETREESDRVLAAVVPRGFQNFWIGLSDEAEEGTFVWASGAPLTYGQWRANEPNNAGNEDCAETYPNGWNDLPCARNKAFLCEPTCAPGTDADGDGVDGCGTDCDDDDPLIGAECP